MTMIKRRASDLDRPTWFGARSVLDWPSAWAELAVDADMRVEEYTDDGHLVVRAEIPGIDPDNDVEITITDHRLDLRAQRRTEATTEDKKGYRSEFRYGSFARSVPLPPGATEDDVHATYSDGILEVRIPIDTAESGAKKIPVERR
jgi:HSP20 family protein